MIYFGLMSVREAQTRLNIDPAFNTFLNNVKRLREDNGN